jgi:hypothetical protein
MQPACEAMGRTRALCKHGAVSYADWAAGSLGPVDFNPFHISELIQILAKFKILYRIYLKSEICEINFVG